MLKHYHVDVNFRYWKGCNTLKKTKKPWLVDERDCTTSCMFGCSTAHSSRWSLVRSCLVRSCRSCQERTWVEATGQEVEESELWVDLGGLNSQLGDMEWYNGLRQYLFVFEIFTLFSRRSIHLSIYPSFKKIYLSCWGWKVNSVFRATAKLRGQNFGEAGLRTELQGGLEMT